MSGGWMGKKATRVEEAPPETELQLARKNAAMHAGRHARLRSTPDPALCSKCAATQERVRLAEEAEAAAE